MPADVVAPPVPDEKSGLAQTLLKRLRDVAVDPTTYAPAVASYASMKGDWDTSQPLFKQGYLEQNPVFTQNGQPNTAPMSYRDGMGVIQKRSLGNLAKQAGNNALVNILSQKLMEKYPDHQKLIKGLGWAEKAGLAGWSSYLGSANHLAQIGKNKTMAQGQ